MGSVMDFLADYYIWFFVAAGILCFALIGFIIESKRKQKNDFKGEEVDENKDALASAPVTPSENINVVGNTVDMNGDVNIKDETNSLPNVENVNTIPLNNEPEEINEDNNIEFYSGPVEMPQVEPAPSFIEPEGVPNEIETGMNENSFTNNPITYEEVKIDAPIENNMGNVVEPATITNIETNIETNNAGSQTIENTESIMSNDNTINSNEIESQIEPEKVEDVNIFDNLN